MQGGAAAPHPAQLRLKRRFVRRAQSRLGHFAVGVRGGAPPCIILLALRDGGSPVPGGAPASGAPPGRGAAKLPNWPSPENSMNEQPLLDPEAHEGDTVV